MVEPFASYQSPEIILYNNNAFVNNLTIKHCDSTKVKTISVKKTLKNWQKNLKNDDVSTFTQRIFKSK